MSCFGRPLKNCAQPLAGLLRDPQRIGGKSHRLNDLGSPGPAPGGAGPRRSRLVTLPGDEKTGSKGGSVYTYQNLLQNVGRCPRVTALCFVLNLMHLGDPATRTIHRARLYARFAAESPPRSDVRRMWLLCAISENTGFCPFCVPVEREALIEFRKYLVSEAPQFAGAQWKPRRCGVPGCALNITEYKKAPTTYLTKKNHALLSAVLREY